MKKFFLSGIVVASVAVAVAATHKNENTVKSTTPVYGVSYQDTIPGNDTGRQPGRDTMPGRDTPPRINL